MSGSKRTPGSITDDSYTESNIDTSEFTLGEITVLGRSEEISQAITKTVRTAVYKEYAKDKTQFVPDYATRMLKCAGVLITNRPHSHGITHITDVLGHAIKIAQIEGLADEITMRLLVPIAVYHDHWDHKYMGGVDAEKNTAGMKGAVRTNLDDIFNYSAAEIELIIEEIDLISYSKRKVPNTVAGMIVQDADRLTAIGPMGIIRCAHYGAEHGLDPECVIQHINDKLLKLGDTMKFESTKWYARVQNLNMAVFRDLYISQSEFAQDILDELNKKS